jgi:RNA polymerase sigma-70 factor, ECF subfamily
VFEESVLERNQLTASAVPRAGEAADCDPDGVFVRDARSGNLAAFEELVRRHEAALFSYLFRLTGNRDSAEELAQAAFVRAWEKLDGFEHRARFKTWLFRIAYNLGINRLTRTRATEELPESLAAGAEAQPPELLRTRQLNNVVRDALSRLPPEQRACLILATYEDMSYQEIGRALGKSNRAVDSLLVRARQNLRRLLEPARRKGLI